MIGLLIIVFVILIWFEVPKLIRGKNWRELAAYSVLMLLAFTVCITQILNISIPNPVRDTQYLIKNLMHLSYD